MYSDLQHLTPKKARVLGSLVCLKLKLDVK
jgi:hypothetical protein